MSESIGAMTIKEVAKELRVSDFTVRGLIERSEIAAVKVGKNRFRILRADFDAYVRGNRTDRNGEAAS